MLAISQGARQNTRRPRRAMSADQAKMRAQERNYRKIDAAVGSGVLPKLQKTMNISRNDLDLELPVKPQYSIHIRMHHETMCRYELNAFCFTSLAPILKSQHPVEVSLYNSI